MLGPLSPGREEDGTCGSPSGIPAGSPPSWRAAPRSGSRRRSCCFACSARRSSRSSPPRPGPGRARASGSTGWASTPSSGPAIGSSPWTASRWTPGCRGRSGPRGSRRRGRLGEEVAFGVIRDGATTTLDVPLGRFPLERLGGAPISLIVFGAGVLVLALILMLRRTRATALRLLFVGAAANVADIAAWEARPATDRLRPARADALRLRRGFPLQHRLLGDDRPHPRDLPGPEPARRAPAGRDPGPLRRPAARVLRARGRGLARRRDDPRPGRPARRLHGDRRIRDAGPDHRRDDRRVSPDVRRPAPPDPVDRRHDAVRRRRDARAADASDRPERAAARAAGHGVVPRPAGPDRARRGRDPGPPVPGRAALAEPGADRRRPRGGAPEAPAGAPRRAGADAGRRRDQARPRPAERPRRSRGRRQAHRRGPLRRPDRDRRDPPDGPGPAPADARRAGAGGRPSRAGGRPRGAVGRRACHHRGGARAAPRAPGGGRGRGLPDRRRGAAERRASRGGAALRSQAFAG